MPAHKNSTLRLIHHRGEFDQKPTFHNHIGFTHDSMVGKRHVATSVSGRWDIYRLSARLSAGRFRTRIA